MKNKLKNLTPKTKKIILITSILTVLIIVAVVLLLVKSSKEGSTNDKVENSNEFDIPSYGVSSYPVSYSEIESQYYDVPQNRGEDFNSNPINPVPQNQLATDYNFANPELVITKRDNIFNSECSPENPPKSDSTIVYDPNTGLYNYISRNVDQYVVDASYNRAFREIDYLFSAFNDDWVDIFSLGFDRPCEPFAKVSSLDWRKFEYPKVDYNYSYYLISFQSGETRTSSENTTMYLTFITRLGKNYSYSTQVLAYEDITWQSTIEECTVLPSGRNIWECLLGNMKADLDQTKIDNLINQFTTTFALE